MSDDTCNLLYSFPLVLPLPQPKKQLLWKLSLNLPSVSKLTSIPCSYEMALLACCSLPSYCCLARSKLGKWKWFPWLLLISIPTSKHTWLPTLLHSFLLFVLLCWGYTADPSILTQLVIYLLKLYLQIVTVWTIHPSHALYRTDWSEVALWPGVIPVSVTCQ